MVVSIEFTTSFHAQTLNSYFVWWRSCCCTLVPLTFLEVYSSKGLKLNLLETQHIAKDTLHLNFRRFETLVSYGLVQISPMKDSAAGRLTDRPRLFRLYGLLVP